jgi:hypothetical protein
MSPGCTTGPPPRHRAASPTLAATFPRPCFDIGELHREPVTAQEWWQALTSTSVPTPAQRATLARRCSCTHVKADHHQRLRSGGPPARHRRACRGDRAEERATTFDAEAPECRAAASLAPQTA